MTTMQRLASVAIPSWMLWIALIWSAAPQAPRETAQVVFLISMAAALVGSIWAVWNVLPRHMGKSWYRAANFGIGVGVFGVVLLIGHGVGVLLASTVQT